MMADVASGSHRNARSAASPSKPFKNWRTSRGVNPPWELHPANTKNYARHALSNDRC